MNIYPIVIHRLYVFAIRRARLAIRWGHIRYLVETVQANITHKDAKNRGLKTLIDNLYRLSSRVGRTSHMGRSPSPLVADTGGADIV